MTSSWTSSPAAAADASPAWELLLPAASGAPRRRGRELGAALRAAVREGRLAAGTRLPSSRELARDLGVSRGLITELYGQLTAEGYLTSHQGAGTWVAALPPVAEAPAPQQARRPSRSSVTDFRPGLPELAAFPRATWSAAYRTALGALPDTALDYPDPQGLPELRVALAELLSRRRGVVVEPDGLIVCSGVAQALTLLGRTLVRRGVAAIAVEDPGSPSQFPLFAAAGLRTVPVPVDEEGLMPDQLASGPARAAVITPAHQFPTGVVTSPRRRAALLGWARRVDGLIVEDDYDGDFRYDRAPLGAVQGLAPELVAYTGSVSKALAPGLRLGWLVPPAGMLDELVEAKRVSDLGNTVTEQAAFAEFLRTGRYDRLLRVCQRRNRERRDTLISALAEAVPAARVTGIAAGLHLVVEFPDRLRPALDAASEAAAVRLHPMREYSSSVTPAPGAFVLGYAHLRPSRIVDAVHRLGEALERNGQSGRSRSGRDFTPLMKLETSRRGGPAGVSRLNRRAHSS